MSKKKSAGEVEGQPGSVRERRDQCSHPAYTKPDLLAERPNEVWS